MGRRRRQEVNGGWILRCEVGDVSTKIRNAELIRYRTCSIPIEIGYANNVDKFERTECGNVISNAP